MSALITWNADRTRSLPPWAGLAQHRPCTALFLLLCQPEIVKCNFLVIVMAQESYKVAEQGSSIYFKCISL